MLAETHERISRRESCLRKLASILNKYIGPAKIADYDQTKYEFTIKSFGVEISTIWIVVWRKAIDFAFCYFIIK